jgi:uncharacterized protein (UPF0248 family)
MLTSHKLLQHSRHDDRYDIGNVTVRYIGRGAPDDRSSMSGPDISREPSSMNVRTTDSGKPVPYHRILLISSDGKAGFENRKVPGLAYQLIEEIHNMR